jgi:hypothetical protein
MEVSEQNIIIATQKKEIDCTEEDRKIRMLEFQKCSVAFTHFLKYCRVIDPPTQGNPGGIVPFQLWPHTLKAVKALLEAKMIIWLKSRQIGASWLVAAYALWYALFHQGTNILMFSKGEVEAQELLSKCKKVFKQLPDFMQLRVNPDSLTEIGFPTMMSAIKAFPATESAGISFTASVIICDEWEEHPFADDNFLASKPTRDAGGQFIGIFTVNKKKPDTLAKAVFKDAYYGKKPEWTWLFDPWTVRPGRTQEWYDSTKNSIPDRDLSELSPELYMEQNYPASVEEALRSSQTVSAFNLKTIDEMMADVRNPISVVQDGIDSNIVHVYKHFNIGDYFIAATDTSHGVGKDFSVTVVMNVRTGEVVADILNNAIPPEELALHTIRLLELYKNPIWWIEKNDYGGVTIATAQALAYKNFGYLNDKKERVGFDTNESTRSLLWSSLIPAVNNRQISIYNSSGLKQFNDIIRNSKKEGRIEAMPGRHDDYPMAVGIAWLKKGEVQTADNLYKPIHTLTFKKPAANYRR